MLIVACDPLTPDSAREKRSETGGPPRVVSLTPLATRFVIALGARERLVAVDPASAALPGAADLPVARIEDAARFAPDLVLVAALPAGDLPPAPLVEFAPHDFEDALPLVREVGARLVGAEAASRFEATFSQPLAKIGGSSAGQARPRVVAVTRLAPLEIAGGHSFETDLIEIAGGHSVTHPGDEFRRAIGADAWSQLAPDLVLVIGAPPASPREEQAVRNALPPTADVAWFTFDPGFWIDASDEPARRLRAVIAPLAARVSAPRRDAACAGSASMDSPC
jgi:ABC-type hemin transport system substrate-binding protein